MLERGERGCLVDRVERRGDVEDASGTSAVRRRKCCLPVLSRIREGGKCNDGIKIRIHIYNYSCPAILMPLGTVTGHDEVPNACCHGTEGR